MFIIRYSKQVEAKEINDQQFLFEMSLSEIKILLII